MPAHEGFGDIVQELKAKPVFIIPNARRAAHFVGGSDEDVFNAQYGL